MRQLAFVSVELAHAAICHGLSSRDMPPIAEVAKWTPAQRSIAHQWVLDCWPVGRAAGWSPPPAPDFVAELLAAHKAPTYEPIYFERAVYEDEDLGDLDHRLAERERREGQSWGTIDRPDKGRTP